MSNEYVVFQTKLVPLLDGDIPTTLLLSQIYYWYRPSEKTGKSKLGDPKLGKWWIAKSAKGWQKETGLSADQVRRGIDVLVAKNLIEVELMKFNGAPTRYIRFVFAQGKQVLNGVDELIHLGFSPISFGPEPKSLVKTTVETTVKKKEGSLSLAAANQDFEEKNDFSKKGKEKEEKMREGGKNLQEILAEASKKKEARKPVVKLTATGMATYWRDLCISHGHGVEYHPATLAELGMWSQMLKLEKDRLPDVVAAVIKHWDSYALDVLHSVGDKGKPVDPSVPYLRKYLTNAVNWFLLRKEQKESHKVPIVPVTAPVLPKKKTKVETSDGPVDWAALEAELQQGIKHGSSN